VKAASKHLRLFFQDLKSLDKQSWHIQGVAEESQEGWDWLFIFLRDMLLN
jgi:hypothetical protein